MRKGQELPSDKLLDETVRPNPNFVDYGQIRSGKSEMMASTPRDRASSICL
jgi:hypothetical protein